MKIYLVGGAVRDKLLGKAISDRDWVVVGATPEQMLARGYQQVGADFPVFLHPTSHEEYALARTERKVGQGYTGFECDASAHVTLEQDLRRRDLSINAMALSDKGELIDPYKGQQDLQNKILRHVSDAFTEDPLRVLRVARFAARFKGDGFTISDETLALMGEIAKSGELEHLSAERVWKETARSLLEAHPEVYFETLHKCGALVYWFGELDVLWGIPNPAPCHPEIDTGVHAMLVLQQAASLSSALTVRFAALVNAVGKGLTPPTDWPSQHDHEKRGLEPINTLCDRLKAPNDCRELAVIMNEFHSHVHHAFELKPATILAMFNRCDAWRKPLRFKDFLTTCVADARGRKDLDQKSYINSDYIWSALQTAQSVDVKAIVEAGYQGAQIKQQLDQQRIATLSLFKDQVANIKL
ncbi:MAG: tRNA nucleotidyltransferase (CCA-adding enzyme) [Paraglaciecola sp.]|jgi:tRNA nucleotidyltransferase (CCA-adding enzyme)